ncbi:hypothetical protein G7Y89_g9383 [Cudoniella acicularis]|uniref:NmrA-like domain-containing protein n=1 Tax=Cudoniella acicularis TaxID=354080 RepID=A0A8H4W058_9HELO|nr:hypothetical protein G7Y89_g9383 [Cudoniella acicularis]
MSKLIVVIGITGIQGDSVATLFSTLAGWKVRGITRNLSSASAQSWISKGVELVQGDLNDPSSLERAFAGAHVIFSVTNFFDPFFNPATKSRLREGQNINQYCYEVELQQGKNIADAAANVQGLERLIISTCVDATKESRGKYTWVYHFDAKARAVEYIHKKYPELAAKMSCVIVGSYMDQWKENLFMRKEEDGSIHLVILAGTIHASMPQIDTVRDLGHIVHAAIQAPPGKKILGSGSSLSRDEQFKEFCKFHGLKYGGCDEVTMEQFEAFLKIPGFGREIGEMMLFWSEFGYAGKDESVVLPGDVPGKVSLNDLSSNKIQNFFRSSTPSTDEHLDVHLDAQYEYSRLDSRSCLQYALWKSFLRLESVESPALTGSKPQDFLRKDIDANEKRPRRCAGISGSQHNLRHDEVATHQDQLNANAFAAIPHHVEHADCNINLSRWAQYTLPTRPAFISANYNLSANYKIHRNPAFIDKEPE